MSQELIQVLLVEDNPDHAELIRRALERQSRPIRVTIVTGGVDCLETLRHHFYSAVLLDYTLSGMDGLTVLKKIRQQGSSVPVIMVTGQGDEEVVVEAMQEGASDYLIKTTGYLTTLPAMLFKVLKLHEIALDNVRLYEETRKAYDELHTLYEVSQSVLSSPDLNAVLEGILDKALTIGPFDLGNVRLFDPDAAVLDTVIGRGYRDPENIQRHRQQARDPKTGQFNLKVFSRKGAYVEEDLPACDGLRTLKKEGIQSAVFVPIRAGEEALGYLQLGSRTPRKFKPEQIHLLEAIGNQMGIAVQKAELYERTKRAAEIQGFLKELSQDITSLEVDRLLKKLTEKVREVFKADISDVRVMEQGTWRVMGASGVEPHRLTPSGSGATRGFGNRTLKQRQPLMVPDITKTDLPTGTTLKSLGVHGYLGAPLFSRKGEAIGVLRALTYQPRVFSQEEIDLLQQLANGAAIAIENARLFEETERRAREQEVLNLVASATNRSLDLKEIFQIALDKVLEVTGRERGYIRLKDPVTGELKLVAHRGTSQEYVETVLQRRNPGGKADQVFQSGEPLVINDIEGTILRGETRREGNSSLLWIPLKVHGKVVGILNMATGQPIPFTPREVELLQAIGNVISVALENARLFSETKTNLERVRALREIESAVISTLDLQTILGVLLEKIDRFLPYSAATIRLINKESGLLEPVACRNLDEKEWKARPGKSGRGLANLVFEAKSPVIIDNVQTDPRVQDPAICRKYRLVSYLGVPLIAKDEVLGVLGFYTKEKPHKFSSEEVEFLTTLAGQVAMAIYNAQLYEQVRTSMDRLEVLNQRLERSLKELSSLYTALSPLAPAESISETMNGIIDRLMDATGADTALIRLQDKTTGALVSAAQRGFPDSYLKTTAVSTSGSATEQVFKSGEPIITSDIAADPRLKGKVQLQVGLRSCAILPLKVGNEVQGIVHLASRETGYFSEEQRDHLMAIARQMGIMLENRDLFDEIKAAKDELERAVKVKTEFLSVMSHELRTPLTSILGYAAMMQDRVLGEINPEHEKALQMIVQQSQELLVMISSIMDATKLESGAARLEYHEFPLGELLDHLKSSYEYAQNKEFTLIWDYPSDLPVVKTDSEKLRHILQNLINNAIKFTEKGHVAVAARTVERVQQQAESNGRAGFVEFRIADTGIGIPAESLPTIFDMFRQVDSSETRRHKGVGLGLYIVKKFTEMLGGRIEVESKPGKGSTFTVTIPRESDMVRSREVCPL